MDRAPDQRDSRRDDHRNNRQDDRRQVVLVAAIGLVLSTLLVAVPAGAALVLGRSRRLKALIVAHLLLTATFGPAVWPTSGFERSSYRCRWSRCSPWSIADRAITPSLR